MAHVGIDRLFGNTAAMGFAKKYVEKKALERIPTPILDAAGKALIEGIDRAVDSRWDRAVSVAAEASGRTPSEKVRSITGPIRTSMAALGAAAGATAAAPGIGTGVAAGTLVGELGVVALRTTDMVMSIGAAHGHLDATSEERRAWVLAVLAFGENAAEEFTTMVRDMGLNAADGRALDIANDALVGGGAGQLATVDALRRINTSLVAQILKKWGARRGAVTLGKLLPFGIGAAVGGSANWIMVREFSKQADAFFAGYDREFVLGMANPDTVQDAEVIDVQSRARTLRRR